MILIEPNNVILVEMIDNCNDGLMFELRGLSGMDEPARGIVALLSLAGKFVQIFSGMTFKKTLDGLIDGFLR